MEGEGKRGRGGGGKVRPERWRGRVMEEGKRGRGGGGERAEWLDTVCPRGAVPIGVNVICESE